MHPPDTNELAWRLDLKLAALGQPAGDGGADSGLFQIAQSLLRNYEIRNRLTQDQLCPVDARIQTFLDNYLSGLGTSASPRLPLRTLVLDRPGMARLASLPPDSASF